ncbi:coiled-coil domain-containing protein 7 isoform X6 [Pseudophryne corroboree]|uniref:coiled-coil domain-containing protein 7 isoform X6 n=1 Tax=Pseudophryne corroboree TaxID=495146 RepID=UPI0030814639
MNSLNPKRRKMFNTTEENLPMVLKPPPETESVLKYAIPLAGSERQNYESQKQIKQIQSKLSEYVAELEDIYGKDNGETTAKHLPRPEKQLVNLLTNCHSAAEELDTTIREQHQILESLLRWFQSQMQLLLQLGEEDISTDRDELESPDTITELISEITDISCKLEQIKNKYQDLSKTHCERPFTGKTEEENKELFLSVKPDLKAGSEDSNKQLERIVQELGKSYDKQAGELQNIEKKLHETENKYMKAEADNQALMEEKRALEYELRKIEALKANKSSAETPVLDCEYRLDMVTLPVLSAVTPDVPQQKSQIEVKVLEQIESHKTMELEEEAEPFSDSHLPSLHKNAKMPEGENKDLYKTPGTPDLLEGTVTEALDATVPEESDILNSQVSNTQVQTEKEAGQSSKQETSLLEEKVVQKPADQIETSAGFRKGSMEMSKADEADKQHKLPTVQDGQLLTELQEPYEGDYNKEAHIIEQGPQAVLLPLADDADKQQKLPTVQDGPLTKEIQDPYEGDYQKETHIIEQGPQSVLEDKVPQKLIDQTETSARFHEGLLEVQKAGEADRQQKIPIVKDGPLTKQIQDPYEGDYREEDHIIKQGLKAALEDKVLQKLTDQKETSAGFHGGSLEVQKAGEADIQQKIPIVKDGPLTKQIQDPYEGDYREEDHIIKQGPQEALEDKVLQKLTDQKETSAGFHGGSLEIQDPYEGDYREEGHIIKQGLKAALEDKILQKLTEQKETSAGFHEGLLEVQRAGETDREQEIPIVKDGPLIKQIQDQYEGDHREEAHTTEQGPQAVLDIKVPQKPTDQTETFAGFHEGSLETEQHCPPDTYELDPAKSFKMRKQQAEQQPRPHKYDDLGPAMSLEMTKHQEALRWEEESLNSYIQSQRDGYFTEQQCQPHTYELVHAKSLKTRIQQTEQQTQTYELDHAKNLQTRMQQTEQQSQPHTYELVYAESLKVKMQQAEQQFQPYAYKFCNTVSFKMTKQQDSRVKKAPLKLKVQPYHNIIPNSCGSQLYIQGRSITLTPKYLSTKTPKCDDKAQKDMLTVPSFLSDETPQ